jgi:hypothetical protein
MTGAFALPHAVPWGRNAAEYTAFFDLADVPADAALLDCAAGPSSFTAEAHAVGRRVVAADPLYATDAESLWRAVEAAREAMMPAVLQARDRFVWDWHGSPDGLEATRMQAMRAFLDDLTASDANNRYIAAALPRLPFRDGTFAIALCSHFLFLYSGHFDLNFHTAALRELLRVAGEARVFPLLDLDGARSRHVEPAIAALRADGFTADVVPVAYEFQRGGNRMLRAARA